MDIFLAKEIVGHGQYLTNVGAVVVAGFAGVGRGGIAGEGAAAMFALRHVWGLSIPTREPRPERSGLLPAKQALYDTYPVNAW